MAPLVVLSSQYLSACVCLPWQQIKDHKKKLAEKEYLDIDKKYKKTQIAIETHRGACKDLDKSLPTSPPPLLPATPASSISYAEILVLLRCLWVLLDITIMQLRP